MSRKQSPDIRVKHHHIVKFEYGNTRAWFVRIERLSGALRKSFSYSKYGGKTQALRAAIKFRNKELKKLPLHPHAMNRGEFIWPTITRSTDLGVDEVWLEHAFPDGYIYQVLYKRAWVELSPGRMCATYYSVDKYGETKATELATEWVRRYKYSHYRADLRKFIKKGTTACD